MPKTVDRSNDGVTFIVGDPRSKQNLSKIRRHASKAPKSAIRAIIAPGASKQGPASPAGSPRSWASADGSTPRDQPEQPIAPPIQSSFSIFRPASIDRSRRNSFEHPVPREWIRSIADSEQGADIDPAVRQYHIETRPSNGSLIATEPPTTSTSNNGSLPGSETHSPHLLHAQQLTLPLVGLRPARKSSSFTTVGTAIGTWFENHPNMQAAATFDHDFDPHKRARLSKDTLNKTLTKKRSLDVPASPESLDPLPARSRRRSSSSMLSFRQSRQDLVVAVTGKSQVKKRKSEGLQTQWRIGAAPSRPLALSATHTSYEQTLLRTNAYHESLFETKWRPMVSQDSTALDGDGRFAALYESSLTIAALIEAGRPAFANMIIQQDLLVMEELLLSEHPRLYGVLSAMALDTTASVVGQFHRKFAKAIVPLAERVLGHEHPCTMLLHCVLPLDMKARLCQAVQKRIHELQLATFGDVHQTCEGVFLAGRTLAQLGQVEDALDVLAWIKPRWEGMHGMNSLLAVYLLIDEASIYLGAGQADIRTEMILSDARRRLKILESYGRQLPELERQAHLVGLAHPQIAALRALGEMHVLRKNSGAALESYRQAASIGKRVLGINAPCVQLAQSDFDRARANSVEFLKSDDFTSDEAEEEIEMVETVLGKIARSKVPFGKVAIKVPLDKAPIYGFLPYENSRWREGIQAA